MIHRREKSRYRTMSVVCSDPGFVAGHNRPAKDLEFNAAVRVLERHAHHAICHPALLVRSLQLM